MCVVGGGYGVEGVCELVCGGIKVYGVVCVVCVV